MLACRFDTPGHAAAICTGYPDACPNPQCLQPLNPIPALTLDIINGVFTEWNSVFPLNYLHLGGMRLGCVLHEVDETCWKNSSDIMAWATARGYTVDQIYEWFVNQTNTMAVALNRSPVRWEEVRVVIGQLHTHKVWRCRCGTISARICPSPPSYTRGCNPMP